MPKVADPLSESFIKRCAVGKHYDGRGLILHHEDNGAKVFRFRSQRGGKEQWKVLGRFPRLTLAAARRAAEKARVESFAAPIKPDEGIKFEPALWAEFCAAWRHAHPGIEGQPLPFSPDDFAEGPLTNEVAVQLMRERGCTEEEIILYQRNIADSLTPTTLH